ncbi:GAF domain-containing sensor histidine kinase [Candidatus Oscillochloris fontis]|uniref:GAF domain-containing sensor histidine kinase n=1 Tax=Candidatus Oscillochloris fontis TaxID=2496868 RepID=UPI001375A8ED|nr:GAF domain-containing sensor histidine kinase [Candidatus Oscillochloris fontis]
MSPRSYQIDSTPLPDDPDLLRHRIAELERDALRMSRIARIFYVTHALAVAMQTAGDISEIHERVLTLITSELGYDRAVLAMIEPHDAVLTGWLCSTDGPGAHLQRMPHTERLPTDDESWAIVEALRRGTPMLITDERPPTGDPHANELLALCCYAILPMVLLGQPLGVILVDNPLRGEPLTMDDLYTLQHVASHTAVLIGGIQAVVGRAQRLAVEEERSRIAMEIHDAISQQLYGITYTIGACIRQLPAHPDAVREQLVYLLPQAQHAAQGLRRAIFDLWPDDLDAARFKEELSGYFEEIAPPPRPRLFLHVDGGFDRLPVVLRRQLYRIAQEVLNNVVKHAQASQAKLTLLYQDGEVVMRIADNGQGFDPVQVLADRSNASHYGLSSMRERADALGGQIRIDSAPGSGTTLTVTLPLR